MFMRLNTPFVCTMFRPLGPDTSDAPLRDRDRVAPTGGQVPALDASIGRDVSNGDDGPERGT
ncbi:hypothetical protein IWW46_005573, partial [Coemansia sp. RSA 2440]